MFSTLDTFLEAWQAETARTQQLMDALTDASLAQPVTPGRDRRTLGRMAWHVVQTLPEMANRTGLAVGGVDLEAPVPARAADIAAAYAATARSLGEQVRTRWRDGNLAAEHDMYGERWTGAKVLAALLLHEVHHRGQMTVLMRQAGLSFPGIYGPTEEEWAGMGMAPPSV